MGLNATQVMEKLVEGKTPSHHGCIDKGEKSSKPEGNETGITGVGIHGKCYEVSEWRQSGKLST